MTLPEKPDWQPWVDSERADAAVELAHRLGHCAECERPFPQPVSEEQARADWGGAADDEIAYACQSCADDFGYGADHYGR